MHFPRRSGVQMIKILKLIHFGHETRYKPTETFQYAHFSSDHPPGVKMVSLKAKQWECLELTLQIVFEESLVKFKQRLRTRG